MKILIFILVFILSGCTGRTTSNGDDSYKDMSQYSYTDFSKEIMDLQVPKHYAEKNGNYGIYFTDYKNIIFIKEVESDKNKKEEIIESLNFYNNKEFPLDGKYVLKEKSNNEFELYRAKGDFKLSKFRVLNKGGKSLILLVSSKEDNVGELYEKLTKKWGDKY